MGRGDGGGGGSLRETGRPGCHCQPHHALPSPATGSLNLLVRSRNKGALDTHAWSLSGNKGNVWQQAHVPINPSGPFQVSYLVKAVPKAGGCPGRKLLGRSYAGSWGGGEGVKAGGGGLPGSLR